MDHRDSYYSTGSGGGKESGLAAAGSGFAGAGMGMDYDPQGRGAARWQARQSGIDQSGNTGGAPAAGGGRKKLWWILGGIVFIVAAVVAIAVGVTVGRKGGSGSGSGTGGSGSSGNTNGTVDVGKDPSVFEKDSRLHNSFYAFAYTPQNVQYGSCGAAQANITKDIQLLSQLTTRLRLYGANCNQTAMVLQAIQDTKVDMSIYVAICKHPCSLYDLSPVLIEILVLRYRLQRRCV